MKEDEIEIILPLNRKVQLNGLLIVGKKEDDVGYTAKDIDFLEGILKTWIRIGCVSHGIMVQIDGFHFAVIHGAGITGYRHLKGVKICTVVV